jgi:hypothetical protein
VCFHDQKERLQRVHGHSLSLMNSNLCRRLILSPFYQERFGHRFALRDDQNNKFHYDTTAGGSRITLSVGGGMLGMGGDINIADDPHDVAGVESAADRETGLAVVFRIDVDAPQ